MIIKWGLLVIIICLYFCYRAVEDNDIHSKYVIDKVFNIKVEKLDDIKDRLETIKYPIIIKPSYGCTGGRFEVKKIDNAKDAQNYINNIKFPSSIYIVEEFIPFDYEITVMYNNNAIRNIYKKDFINKEEHFKEIEVDSEYRNQLQSLLESKMKLLSPFNLDSRIDILVYNNEFYPIDINYKTYMTSKHIRNDTLHINYISNMIKIGINNFLKNPTKLSNDTFNSKFKCFIQLIQEGKLF